MNRIPALRIVYFKSQTRLLSDQIKKNPQRYTAGLQSPTETFSIESSKGILSKERNTILSYETSRHPDVKTFVAYLCDPQKCLEHLGAIDRFISESNLLQPLNHSEKLDKDKVAPVLLQTLRTLTSHLAQEYTFNPQFIETTGGLLTQDVFRHIPENNMLLLDIGERGHGPIPHLASALMMKEMESAGVISDAKKTYQLLVEDSDKPHSESNGYDSFYTLSQDNPNSLGLTNPATLANLLIENHTQLPSLSLLTGLCFDYTFHLIRLSSQDAQTSPENKRSLTLLEDDSWMHAKYRIQHTKDFTDK